MTSIAAHVTKSLAGLRRTTQALRLVAALSFFVTPKPKIAKSSEKRYPSPLGPPASAKGQGSVPHAYGYPTQKGTKHGVLSHYWDVMTYELPIY